MYESNSQMHSGKNETGRLAGNMQGMQYKAVQVAIPEITQDSSAALPHVFTYTSKEEKQKMK